MNQKVAAKELGITTRSLRLWAEEVGFPDCSAGYDVEAIRVWRQSRRKVASTGKYRVPATDDWTVEDWKDLFLMLEAFKRRIGERHAKRLAQGVARE